MKGPVLLVVPLLLVLLAAGCSSVPGADGRYATPARGGWDNFRAQGPDPERRWDGAHRPAPVPAEQ